MSNLHKLPEGIRTMEEAVNATKSFITDMRSRKIKPLKTGWAKLNDSLMNGIDWWRIATVAGTPGAGKSSWLSQFRRDIIRLNRDQKFEILSFELEMRMEDQLTRDLSAITGLGLKDIYSKDTPISDDDYDKICRSLNEMKSSPVYFIEEANSADVIIQTIIDFVKAKEIGGETGLVITLDHSLLTKGRAGEDEKKRVDDLYHKLVALKKDAAAMGIKIIVVILSQLNRDIQSNDRVTNPKLHYPTQNDLFASSATYQCSDYVIILSRPATIVGIGLWYGPEIEGHKKGLPVYCPTDKSKTMLYLHIIKERFGLPKIIACVENFKQNEILEYAFSND